MKPRILENVTPAEFERISGQGSLSRKFGGNYMLTARLAAGLMIHALLLFGSSPKMWAQEILERLDEALTLGTANGEVRADISVLADFEYFASETPLPGLLFGGHDSFFNPRLAVFADLHLADFVQMHGQMRVDRGFDPNVAPDGDVRLDEYWLRVRPLGDDRLNIEAGRMPSVVGNWIPRHLSWDNPFITAPAPYEDVLAITDNAAPPSPAAQLNRRNLPDNKFTWLPLIWGPVYASGAAVFGRLEWFEYAFEAKSAALSSRPSVWEDAADDFDHLTYGARLGARPAPEWAFGASFSHGPYLQELAEPTLPRGAGIDDFNQTTFGLDAAYQHHHWQLWAEVFHSTFEVPNVGDAEILSYYIEARYKFAPQWWLAARWNQSFSGELPNGKGGESDWDRDAWRVELALGHRFTERMQAKLQYSLGDKQGADQEGDHLLAAQVTLRF